jgi:EAL domain-containing protein (putative c-di-GMP-specific phosphodiesterase class I)/DNA-binding NarL/FixJ family response regulator
MQDKSNIHIMVLDDEPFMLKLLVHALAKLGFTRVTACDSGRRALEYVDNPDSVPTLILLDLNMPEMDGVEFVRHLVERRYAGSIILISGEDERMLQSAEKLVQAHKISVLGHLHKPIKLEGLSALLEAFTAPALTLARTAAKMYGADELRNAIKNGELVNYYQPKVEVATGKVVGAETLVRWRHPVDGMVFPSQFIDVAEELRLIDELTRVVLANALTQIRLWHQAGLALKVSVNISMDNLASVDFADYVASQAALAGVAPQEVILEVTESRLMLDRRAPLEILTRLRLKRFLLSIDDFGTGHSSLAQLRDIPFDELKIDQSFVHQAWCDKTARAMYDASLGLARQLGMEVVAEGVEDYDDWRLVRSTGCELAQGYFIARPMPAGDFIDWIKVWQARLPELLADDDNTGTTGAPE